MWVRISRSSSPAKITLCSPATVPPRKEEPSHGLRVGLAVFHTKFGPGTVAGVDGNKLTVDFDKAGRKMVLDSFVQPG